MVCLFPALFISVPDRRHPGLLFEKIAESGVAAKTALLGYPGKRAVFIPEHHFGMFKLRHPRLYQAEFFFIYEEFDLYRSLAISVIWHKLSVLFMMHRQSI